MAAANGYKVPPQFAWQAQLEFWVIDNGRMRTRQRVRGGVGLLAEHPPQDSRLDSHRLLKSPEYLFLAWSFRTARPKDTGIHRSLRHFNSGRARTETYKRNQ
jgi:hypothetical protein